MRMFLLVIVVACASCTGRAPSFQRESDAPLEDTAQIELSSLTCEFGDVVVGDVARCDIEVTNVGTAALEVEPGVDDASFSASAPFDLDPGASTTLRVFMTPTTPGEHAGVLTVQTNDPDEPTFDIALHGTASAGPICTMRVSVVNGVPVDGSVTTLETLDAVTLSLDRSSPADALTDYTWSIASLPAGSGAVLATAGVTTTLELEAAGEYVVCGSVADADGVTSVNECCLTLTAVASEEIRVVLASSNDVDLDLHVAKASDDWGVACVDVAGVDGIIAATCATEADCWAATCTEPGVDWGGLSPLLTEGVGGGETITAVGHAPGMYLVAVHSRAESVANASVSIFLDGRLTGDTFASLAPGEFREIAILYVSENAATCLEDLTDGTVDDDCVP